MLPEIENGLVDCLKDAPIKSFVRAIAVLPDLESDTLVTRMGVDAPAIYVSLSKSFKITDAGIVLSAGIACIAKNSRSPLSARHGEAGRIGLLEMLDQVINLMDCAQAGGAIWSPVSATEMADAKLEKAGLYAAVVNIETTAPVPLAGVDMGALPDFLRIRTDYDVGPRFDAAEHDKWAGDPSDHTTSAPALTDQQHLQEE
ncbi:hypothetical protein DLREEDagrD3_28970 [Denitratisoma sp. agr-D3]